MGDEKVLRVIRIVNYPDRIITSKSRRPRYYKEGSVKIPKKYLTDPSYIFDKKGFLINSLTKEKVVSNPRTAFTEKHWVVNFQDIWTGKVARQSRAHKAEILKEVIRPYLKKVKPINSKDYPIGIKIILRNSEFNVDASNKGPVYVKIIEDLLTAEGIIVDDSPQYINDTGRIKLEVTKERPEMIIIIFKSS
jgi:hypothetical protein